MHHPFFQDGLSLFADIDAFIAALEESNNSRAPLDGYLLASFEEKETFHAFGDCESQQLGSNKTGVQLQPLDDASASSCGTTQKSESSSDSIQTESRKGFDPLDDSEGMSPSIHDVIFGKGGRSKHPGNETFRMECERLAPLSLANPSKRNRQEIVLELVGFVFLKGGCFLMEDPNRKGVWRRAGFDLACKKARQLLVDTTKRMKKEMKK